MSRRNFRMGDTILPRNNSKQDEQAEDKEMKVKENRNMTNRWNKQILATTAFFLVSSFAAYAEEAHFVAHLNATEAAPEGVGTLRLTLNEAGTALSYQLTYTSLDSRADVSAIRVDPPASESTRSAAILCGTSGRPECPAAGGTVSGVITAQNIRPVPSASLTAHDFSAFVQLLKSSSTVAVVHDMDNDSGDIRGQIRPVME